MRSAQAAHSVLQARAHASDLGENHDMGVITIRPADRHPSAGNSGDDRDTGWSKQRGRRP